MSDTGAYGTETGFHRFAGLQVRYGIRRGEPDGVPLVIFNGVGQSIEVLGPLIEALEGVEVIVHDVPGTGLSDTPRLPWSYRRHAALAADLARVLAGPLEATAAREATSSAERSRVLSRASATAVASLLTRMPRSWPAGTGSRWRTSSPPSTPRG